MIEYIHQSNLIEGYNNHAWDIISFGAWKILSFSPRITERLICQVQRIITSPQDDMQSNWRGEYRKIPVYLGERICLLPAAVLGAVKDYCKDMVNYRKLDPKEMHIRFEHIHPFVDGNGRTGRMLMWWHEVKLGREPTLIKNAEKQDYYKWF